MAHTQSISDVQDILYDVFPHLDPGHYASREEIARVRQTLFRSALTCKNFTRPALNILWKHIPSEEPLLSLLFLYNIVQTTMTSHGAFSLQCVQDPRIHPLWERFQDYASRVRTITLHPLDVNSPGRSVWGEITARIRGDPILPALQTVLIDTPAFHTGSGVSTPLIAPSTRTLSVSVAKHWMTSRDELQAILREAYMAAPLLERLYIRIPRWDVDLSTLSAHERLRSIEIEPHIPIAALQPLAPLPHLENLLITIPENPPLWGNADPPVTLQLPGLRRLTLKGDWANVESFLVNVQLPKLSTLFLTIGQYDGTRLIADAARCFQALSAKHPGLTLLSVDCRQTDWSGEILQPGLNLLRPQLIGTGGTLMDTVKPLLSLSSLRSVALRFYYYTFRYESADIRAFAEAWHDLETFELLMSTLDGPRAGFESLAHLALHCPRLRTLRMPVMSFGQDAAKEVVYPGEAHALRELDVAEVVFPKGMDLSYEVTEFAQRVFPHAATPLAEYPIVVTNEDCGDRSRVI